MRLQYVGLPYLRTLGLLDGTIQPEGVAFQYAIATGDQLFLRAPAGEAPDAKEAGFALYIIDRARDDDTFVARLVFPSRAFRHNSVFVHTRAGIDRPEDLRGKRVGLPAYAQTANFWVRAFLQHDYGVPPEAIQWVCGHRERYPYPPPASLAVAGLPPGRSVSDLLESGEIDAVISPDRPACFVAGSPRIRRLFPNFVTVEAEYYRRTGHFPIMHVVVLRRDVYESDRSIARRVYDAFVQAKADSYGLSRETGFLVSNDPLQVAHTEETQALFGDDPFPYGLATNRHTISALLQYIHEQGYTERVLAVEELFVPELLDT
jgi:4,5-dihydroxyphthalate decarboxylase